jgi:GH15 family glucan-1,4-alpha-glucosidase
MAWVALDRAVALSRDLELPADRERWQEQARRIRATVLAEGYDAGAGTFVSVLGGDGVDAALLEVATSGMLDADDARVGRTIDRIRDELSVGPLVYRYRRDDGLAGEEGAFVPCSFWLAEALARAGRRAEALEVFSGAGALANDVGLLPEEVDPQDRRALGNFPQGLSHIALVKAACALRASRQPSGR